jgi:hypothetical protein
VQFMKVACIQYCLALSRLAELPKRDACPKKSAPTIRRLSA